MNLEISNTTCEEIIYTQGGVSHSLDKLYYGQNLVWEKQTGPVNPYATQYFTIESLENGNTVSFNSYGTVDANVFNGLEYSTNGSSWDAIIIGQTSINLDAGDKVYIRGNNSALGSGNAFGNVIQYTHFDAAKTTDIYGNIMSLLYGNNFVNQISLTTDFSFTGLLMGSKAVHAHNLIMPARTMTSWGYKYMFINCTTLISAPQLPATTLVAACYESMFENCSSLTTAPDLPALTVVNNQNGNSGSYMSMFKNCSNLNYIKCLATNINWNDDPVHYTSGTYLWVEGVAANGTFIKNSAMNDWPDGDDGGTAIYDGIPAGWTVTNL